jgi:hypothetical protein
MLIRPRFLAGVVRFGVAGLAVVNGWWGAWARFWPRSFFDRFPGFGHHWTAAYPPYNEHLVTDLGATFLTLAVLLAIAAGVADRRVRTVVLVGVLVFNALHLSYHLNHHQGMPGVDVGTSLGALGVGAIAPVVLLVLDRLVPVPDPPPPVGTP